MDAITSGTAASATLATSKTGTTASTGAVRNTSAPDAAAKQQGGTTTTAPKQDHDLQRDPRSLQFQVDGNRVITTIVDENDNTVVVQIPDADMISIAKAIDRMQGFLVKEKA